MTGCTTSTRTVAPSTMISTGLWGLPPAPVWIAGDGRYPLLHLDASMERTLADIQRLEEAR